MHRRKSSSFFVPKMRYTFERVVHTYDLHLSVDVSNVLLGLLFPSKFMSEGGLKFSRTSAFCILVERG